MTREQSRIKEFMQLMEQATPEKPAMPDFATRKLRVKLLLEEVLEFANAVGVDVRVDPSEDAPTIALTKNNMSLYEYGNKTDLVEAADALADIDYVNLGAAVALGIDLEPVQTEVHESNMTKLWSADDINNAPAGSLDGYKIKPVGTRFLVKRSDGKVIKAPSYQPAAIAAILNEQGA